MKVFKAIPRNRFISRWLSWSAKSLKNLKLVERMMVFKTIPRNRLISRWLSWSA
jgi:hypothetical protein